MITTDNISVSEQHTFTGVLWTLKLLLYYNDLNQYVK